MNDKELLAAKKLELQALAEEMTQKSAAEQWDALTVVEEAHSKLGEAIEELEARIVADLVEEASENEDSESGDSESEDKALITNASTVAKAKNLREVSGNTVSMSYEADLGSDDTEDNITKGCSGRRKKSAEDYRPSPEQLAKINALSNIDLEASDVYVFSAKAADLELDRSLDKFTRKALNDIKELCVDKPFQKDHSHSITASVGKTFDAEVKDKGIYQTFYMMDSPENASLLKNMFGGIINKVSVGFSMNLKDYVCSSCNKSVYSMQCPHYPGMTDEKGEMVFAWIKGVSDYYETSLVAVPAQRSAGIRRNELKSVIESPQDNEEDETVGRIINDKSLTEEVSVKDQKSDVTDNKAVDATSVVDETTEEVVSDVVDESKNDELKSLVEGLAESLKELKEAQNSIKEQLEEIKKSLDVFPTREELAKASEQQEEPVKVVELSMNEPGGLLAHIAKHLS